MMNKLAVVALVLSFMVGCTAPMKKFEAAKHPQIKTIAVLSVGGPGQYSLEDYGNVFGVIGGLVNGVSKEDAFNMLLSKNGYDFAKRMQSELKKRLESVGYKVIIVEAERKTAGALLDSYEQFKSVPADAYLDVASQLAGYASKNMTDSAYRPYLNVRALLLANGGDVAYQEHFAYGLDNPLWNLTEIPAPKDYYFADFSELESNEQRAVQGLEEGTDTVARTLADRLARN